MTENISEYVDLYIEYLRSRETPDNTWINYRVDLRLFRNYVVGQGITDVADIDTRAVRIFLDSMLGYGDAKSSAARRLSAVKGFTAWLTEDGKIARDPSVGIKGFDKYVCDEPEKINIDTDEFMRVLKRSKANDRVLMAVDEGNFIITFEGEATRTFKIRLIDIEYDNPAPPQLQHPTKFEVPFTLLKDSINDIEIFSDKICFEVDSTKFTASADGEFGDASVEYLHGEEISEDVKSSFSLDKIREMLKADKFSDVAEISLGTDMPLSLTLKMVTGDGRLSFLLAPRLESED